MNKQEEQLLENLHSYIDKNIYLNDLKKLVTSLIDSKAEEFLTYPAAIKHHHNYEYGLLLHTLEVVEGVKYLIKKSNFDLSKTQQDILITSAFLHDFAKVQRYEKYDINEYYYQDYSDYHKWWYDSYDNRQPICVELSPLYIREKGIELNIDNSLINDICFAIQCHHGIKSWGSKHNLIDVDTKKEWVSLLFAADYASSKLASELDLNTLQTSGEVSEDTLKHISAVYKYLKGKRYSSSCKSYQSAYKVINKIIK